MRSLEILLLGRVGDRVEARLIVAQERRQAVIVGHVEHEVDARLPQVRVDEEDSPARLGEGHGEVRRGDGLALARHRARHEEGPDRRIDGGELDIRPEDPVRLRGAERG